MRERERERERERDYILIQHMITKILMHMMLVRPMGFYLGELMDLFPIFPPLRLLKMFK